MGVLASLCLAAQCAGRSPALTPSQRADLARADALVRDGCYRCLQDALGIYTSLTDVGAPSRRASPPDRALREPLRAAFDTTLLLAVREKEVGAAADASLARARALLPRLSQLARVATSKEAPPHADPSTLLQAAEAIAGEQSGLDSEEREQRAVRQQQQQQRAAAPDAAGDPIGRLQQALHASAATDLTAAYLALAIDCEQGRSRPAPPAPVSSASPAPTPADVPPLLHYRRAICSSAPPTSLTPLREGNPRWTEIFFFEGKYEMGSPARAAEPARAAALLTSASEAFPESIAVRVMLANAHEMNGDFAPALASFDRVLAAKPAHVDARLGRVRNLSYLGRADEAIATATTLIDQGTWHVGDAYYWRAWNHYQTRRLDPAWADVQQSLSLLSNTAVYALAGSIAQARRELDTAVRHFDRAFEIDASNCLAIWSAGLVNVEQAAWPSAADRLSKATSCFAVAAKTARTELAALEKSTRDPAANARRIESARKRIASAEELGGQAALNAAQSFVQTGQKSQALTYLELAERHPATRDKARALRSQIDSLR